MEILGVLLIVIFVVAFLKLFFVFLNTGIFLLALPFKIILALLSLFAVFVVLLPLGIVGAVAGLLVAPLLIIVLLLPVILIIYGIFLLINRS